MFLKTKTGFTLVELAVTLAILCIIASMALPKFHQYMAERELQSTLSKLISASRAAKHLALIHHSNIVICPSQTLLQCENAKWNSGFILFADRNANRQVDSNEAILTAEKLNLKYGTLDWKGTLSLPSLSFQAMNGLPIGSNGGFYYCSLMGLRHHKLNLSKMGHTRIEYPASC